MGFALIRIDQAPDGALTYDVDQSPALLPPVRSGDLAVAWDSARHAALNRTWGGTLRFRFRLADGEVTELKLEDRDAACWAAAIEEVRGLNTAYGLSLCLRFLALVDLLARAGWTRGLCRVERHGMELHPALLRVAAGVELTEDARFDETRMRTGLGVLASPGAFA